MQSIRTLLLSPILAVFLLTPATTWAASCAPTGLWQNPTSGEALVSTTLIESMAQQRVVLLGESHSSSEDHLWQVSTLAALHGRRSDVVIGMEMFPRRVQPVLDRWVTGQLTEEAFLEAVEWERVWGFDPDFYLPIMNFARQHRLPLIALNVERSLVSRVGDEGWSAVPEDQREGLSDPAPVLPAYRDSLAEVYRNHASPDDRPSLEEVLEDPGFARFISAQLVWDRAMAEGLAKAGAADPNALLIGIVGRGHAEYDHGIPHQLADLGIAETAVLLPLEAGRYCAMRESGAAEGIADAVFLVESQAGAAAAAAGPPRPRLGVGIAPDPGGVAVTQVVADSVAAATGIEEGDVIERAAGVALALPADLVTVIQRQAPGTWLPLTVKRGKQSLDLVAKFPTLPEATE